MLSRIAGLIRESVFAHYFGNSNAAGAFKAAFRIPNFLQICSAKGCCRPPSSRFTPGCSPKAKSNWLGGSRGSLGVSSGSWSALSSSWECC